MGRKCSTCSLFLQLSLQLMISSEPSSYLMVICNFKEHLGRNELVPSEVSLNRILSYPRGINVLSKGRGKSLAVMWQHHQIAGKP